MIGTIFLLIIFTPLFFCPLDMIYYITIEKRITPWIRIFYEVIVLTFLPFLAHCFRLTGDIVKLITPEAFYSLSALCIISYFVTSYSKSTYSLTGEILFTISILSGFIINLLLAFLLFGKGDSSLIFVGCLPISLMLGTGLIQQYKRCRRCYYWEDYATEQSI